MRTRLLVIVCVLVGLLALGLGVPLAVSNSRATQQELFIDRLTDTIYFASRAQRPITEDTASGLREEIARYDEVYGVAVTVVDRAGRVVAASRAAPPELDADGRERLQVALASRRSAAPPLIMPWDTRPLVLAEPVLVDGEVRGAAITVSPTDALRAAEIRVWSLVAALVLAALALGVLVAVPVTRWILRPVRRLDEGTGRVTRAVLAGRPAEPVSDGSGPPELRRLTLSFDRMAESVGQALSTQRAFVADASHQLRNPLTALRLRLSNLDGRVGGAAAEEHVAAMEEAERLSGVLDGLLALARAERDAGVDREVDTPVDPAVEDRLDAWRPLAEHTGLRLLRGGVRGLRVRIAPGGIETVLDALLDNAVKFTPSGGTVTVTVRPVRGSEPPLVDVAVLDTGPGIPPEELERATDRFWRSPGQNNVEGSGLGLAIAARTVELAGGSLVLELPPRGGLKVAARLRRAPGPEA
ncbi:HAMP domain-containing sensor histidine kinase [Pseudonocardia yuanmonensis]|uniref:histidine kinase n=1 Tax=Pseudonocardia yuanmonensis TaxID=1095914 RepID=A0ABP8XFU3_9PSEU